MTPDLIRKARERISDLLPPTPLVRSHALSREARRTVWLKLETQQPTGSFKVRPAFNGILAQQEEARRRGVLTSSSGNFAQAVAYAARETGVDAQIVMMGSSSPYKIAQTEALGARVVLTGNSFEERWKTTYRLEAETGRLLLHPYDSEETIAGDGTLGLELLEQLPGDFTVAIPVSGAGLVAGVAAAVKSSRPGCRVLGAQPEANASLARSLEAGRPVSVGPVRTIADALIASQPGLRSFQIARLWVDQVVLAGEQEMAAAVRRLAIEQKIIAEAGGAVAVATLLAGKLPAGEGDLVCVISGGNILPSALASLLTQK